jgi:xylulokinase
LREPPSPVKKETRHDGRLNLCLQPELAAKGPNRLLKAQKDGTLSMNDVPLFLGLDSSTQSLKAVAIDAQFKVAAEFTVNFDADLPAFKTQGGVHRGPDSLTVTSPPQLWVAALDLLLDRMKAAQFPFSRVAAISGSGQQHGSVYFKKGARAALQALSPTLSLHDQTQDIFAVAASPIWMDSSTTAQCRALEKTLGGPQAVADLTGSRAYERFTGNQIAKISQTQPANYGNTERIALVSSFVASLLIGDYAPIDVSDGSGMNLLDVRKKAWAPQALAATAPNLAEKLGTPVASHALAGKIHACFVQRYGFNPACLVIASSGDNPCSLAGLRLQKAGDVAISLGTSDTLFASLSDPKPSASEGHIFASPVDPAAYMAMIVYKNGSLTREDVRDRAANRSWKEFTAAMNRTQPGNGGHIGFFIKEPEITPPILKTGIHRFGPNDARMTQFTPDVEVRAVVEGQFLSMRLHSAHVGIAPATILATGGASVDMGMLRIMSDVFGAPVFTADKPNSAALGAAYRALHGHACRTRGTFVPFAEALRGAPPFIRTMEPDKKAHALYTEMLKRYEALEKQVAGG